MEKEKILKVDRKKKKVLNRQGSNVRMMADTSSRNAMTK